MTEPEITGAQVLRDALHARAIKSHYLSLVARDYNIALAALEDFVRLGSKLPPEVLNRLARDLFGDNASYDPQRDLLVRTTAEARPLGNRPPSIDEMDLELPTFTGGPAPVRPRHAALPGTPQRRRPGWADK
jgi:hypothetical protein